MIEMQVGQEKKYDAAGCAGKMSPEPSPQISVKTSNQYSRRLSASQNRKPPLFLFLKTDGHTQELSWEKMEPGAWHTELWMQNTGEYPRDAFESSLSQILQEQAHPKYYLSAKACLGILRRADRRGKTITPILRQALERQAGKENQ